MLNREFWMSVMGRIVVVAPAALLIFLGVPTLLGFPRSERATDRAVKFAVITGLLASLVLLGLMLTGLASVGFPGTFGFMGSELLVDDAVVAYPFVGVAVVLATALNGIAIVQAYFRLFMGTTYVSSVSINIRVRERYAVLLLAGVILIGGLNPQPLVYSRCMAAKEILEERKSLSPDDSTAAAKSLNPQ